MGISNTLQQVGFTSGALPVLGCFTERRFAGEVLIPQFGKHLQKRKTQTKGNLSLIDTNGKTIMTQKITNLTIPVRLDTKSYSSGSYLLTMQGADGTLQTTQLVKIN